MTYLYFTLCHLLADGFQSHAMRLGKVSDSFLLAEHFFTHFILMLLAGLGSRLSFPATLLAATGIATAHILQDRYYWPWMRTHKMLPTQATFYEALIIDQLFHLGVIFLVLTLLKRYAFLV